MIVLDPRIPDTADFLLRELRAWRGYATVEEIDDDHCALIVRPGLANRIMVPGLTNREDKVQ